MSDKFWAGARVHLTEVDPGTGALCGNVGLHVGDQESLVRDRRRALAARLGREIVWMDQSHSTRVDLIVRGETAPILAASGQTLGRPATGEWGPVDADGIIVDARDWQGAPALAVQTADCLPVVFSAASGQIVAAVHAGRRGLLGGILEEAAQRIRSLDGGPVDALIGPAICGRCYEVPSDMADGSEALMPGIRSVTSWGTPALDLPRAAASSLAAQGVRVDIDERCTLEDADLFSYRADSSCGRQALVIVPA